ncbi:MAG: hypothetical protein M3417_09355 [Actinomycetota bacterium]|nr:hypothetical protein [Actinomycetota bacterium]
MQITMKLIQIRNVPDEVHQRLKVRAAQRGTTMSQLAYDAVVEYAERPTLAEFHGILAEREPVNLPAGGAASAVSEARAQRPS